MVVYNTLMTETQTITEKQEAFLRKLIAERTGYSPGFKTRLEGGLDAGLITRTKASEVIGWLLEKPRAVAEVKSASEDASSVPAGFYAIESLTGNNDLDFVRVDRPDKGKWAGYVFVKRIVGGHPEFPVKGAAKHAVLQAIADEGPAVAAQRYGSEIGKCCHCGRTLTDEESRKLGIGPVCRGDVANPLVAMMFPAAPAPVAEAV